MNDYAVGIDIGGSHICCCVVNLQSMTIVEGSMAHRYVDNKERAENVLGAWMEAIWESVAKSGVKPHGAGFAFPGPFDYQHGVSQIEGVNKFENIFGLDVAQSMLDRLSGCGIKQIKFVNDASAFAIGESVGGAARGIKNVMVLTLGTGFGSGFISDGKLITSGDRVPANGWVYCLPFEDGIADDAFSTRWFIKRYAQLTGGEAISGAKDLAERIATDVNAQKVFEEYGRRLAEFIAPVCNRFGGEIVVLGGNISRAFPLFTEKLASTLVELECKAQVKVSALHDKAAMIGAAALFL